MVSSNRPHTTTLEFNVAGLLKGPIGGTRSYDVRVPISEIDRLDEAYDATGPLIADATLLRTGETILAVIDGVMTVQLSCARCLDDFEAELPIQLEEEYFPSIDINTGRVIADRGEDDALIIDQHHILDMTELVRQGILLALPLVPICRQDCAGLCPICGVNRNHEHCQCSETTVDPRWSALSAFLDVSDDEPTTA